MYGTPVPPFAPFDTIPSDDLVDLVRSASRWGQRAAFRDGMAWRFPGEVEALATYATALEVGALREISDRLYKAGV